MTDLVNLAQRLHRRIKWQEIPEEMTSADLIDILIDAIRMLYVISGRTFSFSDDMIVYEEDAETGEMNVTFSEDLALDEQEWVLLKGEIGFYNMVLSNVDDLQSYTTDAMSVTHGDKPYKNVKATVDARQADLAVVWTRMVRFNQLGVSG